MSVAIGRVLTEVVPAPETPEASGSGGGGQGSTTAAVERLRRELARAERIAERTRAEGFED
ncbi:MAG TPA: hypothetical protein VN783_03970 [Thermoanaerobaculia bacterium]|nr:hypothetical protein [Thermoanaerobaculia bacterium]